MSNTTVQAAGTGLPDDDMIFCDAVSPIEMDEYGFAHIHLSKVRSAELSQDLAPAAHLVMSVAMLRTLGVYGLRALAEAGARDRRAQASAWSSAFAGGHA